MSGKRVLKKQRKKIGFTNTLAIYVLIFLAAGLAGGFYLALKSIEYNYMGALACWSVAFAPIGTVASLALGKVVDKNKAENMGGNGDGITFAAAQASGFTQNNGQCSIKIEDDYDINSPAI